MLNIKSKPVTALLTLALLLFASDAMAVTLEYYTYDGYQPIVDAFTKTALIFKDNQYALIGVVAMLVGIVAGGFAFFIRQISGVPASPIAFGLPVLLGMCIFIGLVNNRANLAIYDEYSNNFTVVGDIPVGVAYLSVATNRIERGFIDLLDTNNPANRKIDMIRGALNFSTVNNFLRADFHNPHLSRSIHGYINDCVFTEISRPGSTLSVASFMSGTNNFSTQLALANSPAVFTEYFSAAQPNGATASCDTAWTSINALLNNAATYDDMVKGACGMAGFDVTFPTQLQQCKDLIGTVIQEPLGVAGGSYVGLAKQSKIANIFGEVIRTVDPSSAAVMAANRDIATSGYGTLLTINTWLPYLKAVITVVAIGLIPFFALFIPTPLASKALSAIAGFFVFLAAWGVTDAIVTSAAGIYAMDVFEEARTNGLGLETMLNFPGYNEKVMAVFGMVRSAGIMLAGMISFMLIRFGGHFLAGVAGNLSGAIQGASSKAGTIMTPEGKTAAIGASIAAAGASNWYNSGSFDFKESSSAHTNQMSHSVGSGLGMQNVESAKRSGYTSSSMDTFKQNAIADRFESDQGSISAGAQEYGSQQGDQVAGNVAGGEAAKEEFGSDTIYEGSKIASGTAAAQNLGKAGADSDLPQAMEQTRAMSEMKFGQDKETKEDFIDEHHAGNAESAGKTQAAVQNHGTLGTKKAAEAFAEKNDLSDDASLTMLGAANQLRFSGAAADIANKGKESWTPGAVNADTAEDVMKNSATSMQTSMGNTDAQEDMAALKGTPVRGSAHLEGMNSKPHQITNDEAARLNHATSSDNFKAGDFASYSAGPNGLSNIKGYTPGQAAMASGQTHTDNNYSAVDGNGNHFEGSMTSYGSGHQKFQGTITSANGQSYEGTASFQNGEGVKVTGSGGSDLQQLDISKSTSDHRNTIKGAGTNSDFIHEGGHTTASQTLDGEAVSSHTDGVASSRTINDGGSVETAVTDMNGDGGHTGTRIGSSHVWDKNYRVANMGSEWKGDAASAAAGELVGLAGGSQEAIDNAQDGAGMFSSAYRQTKELALPNRGDRGSSGQGSRASANRPSRSTPNTPGPVQNPPPSPTVPNGGGSLGSRANLRAGQGSATYPPHYDY